MEQEVIDKITGNILKLNDNKELQYEFICALTNCKSMIENKLAAEAMKITYKETFKMLARNLSK
jgi:hypothetical protein